MLHGHFLNMGGFTLVSTDIHKLKEPESPGPEQEASGILRAAYLSRWKDYKKNCERCYLGVLTFEQFKELLQNPDCEFPTITAAEIKDRSKGDALSKLIAILQTTCFILQCIARGQQRLALTELELVTLALASLNAVTYTFWWHKPLGVQDPIRIYLRGKTEVAVDRSGAEDLDQVQPTRTSFEGVGVFHRFISSQWDDLFGEIIIDMVDLVRNPCRNGPINLLARLFFCIPIYLFGLTGFYLIIVLPLLGIGLLLKIIKLKPPVTPSSRQLDGRGFLAAQVVFALRKFGYRIISSIDESLGKGMEHVIWEGTGMLYGIALIPTTFVLFLAITAALLSFFTMLSLVSFIFTAVFGIITTNSIAPGASHVPAFYSPTTKSDKYSRMIVFASFGVFFGGLHCIGWNFSYPTVVEQNLWRTTALAITAIPVIVAPLDYVLENFALEEGFSKALRLSLDLVITILLFIYVPARLFLIAQALILLRSQPQSAFSVVNWTVYLPHIL